MVVGERARIARLSEIALESDEHDLDGWTVVADFGNPARLDVLQRHRIVDAEAQQYNVGVGVRQGAQLVKLLLTSCIPQCQFHRESCMRVLDVCVVFKYRRLATRTEAKQGQRGVSRSSQPRPCQAPSARHEQSLLCLWKLVSDEHEQQARLARCSVAENQHLACDAVRLALRVVHKSAQRHLDRELFSSQCQVEHAASLGHLDNRDTAPT